MLFCLACASCVRRVEMAAEHPAEALFSTSRLPDQPPALNVRCLYDRFNAPLMDMDCGARCAPHNPSGKPFCCDICHAVPAAYHPEWEYLSASTDLWHAWRGDECPDAWMTPPNCARKPPRTCCCWPARDRRTASVPSAR